MCVVVAYKDGKKQEHLIDTPKSNEDLFTKMLKFAIGYSMIRAVKSVDAQSLTNIISSSSLRRHA